MTLKRIFEEISKVYLIDVKKKKLSKDLLEFIAKRAELIADKLKNK